MIVNYIATVWGEVKDKLAYFVLPDDYKQRHFEDYTVHHLL